MIRYLTLSCALVLISAMLLMTGLNIYPETRVEPVLNNIQKITKISRALYAEMYPKSLLMVGITFLGLDALRIAAKPLGPPPGPPPGPPGPNFEEELL